MQKIITEKQLLSGAAALRTAMLQSLPDEPADRFSPDFARRIELLKLIHREEEKRRLRRKRVIAAVLALLLATSMLLSLNPQVNAAVTTWFKQVFSYTEYWFKGHRIDNLPDCPLTMVPQGYELIREETTSDVKVLLFRLEDDPDALFYYQYGKLSEESPVTVFANGDQVRKEEVIVNGLPGQLYVSLLSGRDNELIWFDEANGVYFYMAAGFEPALLLELAQAVELSGK